MSDQLVLPGTRDRRVEAGFKPYLLHGGHAWPVDDLCWFHNANECAAEFLARYLDVHDWPLWGYHCGGYWRPTSIYLALRREAVYGSCAHYLTQEVP